MVPEANLDCASRSSIHTHPRAHTQRRALAITADSGRPASDAPHGCVYGEDGPEADVVESLRSMSALS